MTLATLFAGAFIGIGLGIIFKYGGTTGGVDIIARLAHKYVGWSMGKTMFMFDAIVIIVSILTYLSYREGMYTLVAVFIGAKVIDFMQEGAYASKKEQLLSPIKTMKFAAKILSEMERGATFFKSCWIVYKKWNGTYCIALLLKMKS